MVVPEPSAGKGGDLPMARVLARPGDRATRERDPFEREVDDRWQRRWVDPSDDMAGD
jgi:hypothetical protein